MKSHKNMSYIIITSLVAQLQSLVEVTKKLHQDGCG